MSDEGGFLSRWSRRKSEARQPPVSPAKAGAQSVVPAPAVIPAPDESIRGQAPAGTQPEDSPAVAAPEPAPLPSVDSLTPESDFAPFMQSEVDPGVRQEALKKLFADPRYNVMDGLDVYIDDYSKPDPLPEGWLEKMNQVARLGEYIAPAPVDPEREAAAATVEDASGEPPSQEVSMPATAEEQAARTTRESGGKDAA